MVLGKIFFVWFWGWVGGYGEMGDWNDCQLASSGTFETPCIGNALKTGWENPSQNILFLFFKGATRVGGKG